MTLTSGEFANIWQSKRTGLIAINDVLTTRAVVVKLADLRHWRVMTGGKKIISGHRNRSLSSPCLKSPINRDDGSSRAQARLDKGWAILIRSGTSCFGTSTITYLADLLGRNESAWLKHKVNTICLGNCRVINRLGSEPKNFPLVITVFVFEIHPSLKSPFAVAKPALIDSKRDGNTKYSKK